MPLSDNIVTHLEAGNPWELVSEIREDTVNEKVRKFYCKRVTGSSLTYMQLHSCIGQTNYERFHQYLRVKIRNEF